MKRKKRILNYLIVFWSLVLILSGSCKKDDDNNTVILPPQPLVDIMGNVYNTVNIGSQTWMAENLKVTMYNDSTEILLIEDRFDWEYQSKIGYCWYDNDITNKNIYGALYKWEIISKGKLCPKGWHVSTENDWNTLVSFLVEKPAFKLMETGHDHWPDWNDEATNSTGFTARHGGKREGDTGYFEDKGMHTYWWTSTNNDQGTSYARRMTANLSIIQSFWGAHNEGYSVRC